MKKRNLKQQNMSENSESIINHEWEGLSEALQIYNCRETCANNFSKISLTFKCHPCYQNLDTLENFPVFPHLRRTGWTFGDQNFECRALSATQEVQALSDGKPLTCRLRLHKSAISLGKTPSVLDSWFTADFCEMRFSRSGRLNAAEWKSFSKKNATKRVKN